MLFPFRRSENEVSHGEQGNGQPDVAFAQRRQQGEDGLGHIDTQEDDEQQAQPVHGFGAGFVGTEGDEHTY